MRNIVLRFGLISGGILAAMTATMIPLCMNGTMPFENSEVLGYSAMVIAFLMVFFGVRTYRDTIAGGTIGFGRAFKVGILITLITCAVYVISWQIVFYGFIPDFMDYYTTSVVDKLRASGAGEAEVAKKATEMAKFAELYANPLINIAFTFIEVFPVGLIVTLVSAAILRRPAGQPTPTAAVPA